MADTVFGSVVPMWPAMPSPSIGWFQTPVGAGNRAIGTVPPGISGTQGVTSAGGLSPDLYGLNSSMMPSQAATVGFPSIMSNPFGAVTFPAVAGPDIGASAAPALVAAVAMRRGQPLGPTTDQEIEDFICDALDLLPGANDVEVRCEGGRAALTGSVQHKRVKRDVGEIAWAIPGINDVQNNVTIAPRRRSRTSIREGEASPVSAAPTRKQT